MPPKITPEEKVLGHIDSARKSLTSAVKAAKAAFKDLASGPPGSPTQAVGATTVGILDKIAAINRAADERTQELQNLVAKANAYLELGPERDHYARGKDLFDKIGDVKPSRSRSFSPEVNTPLDRPDRIRQRYAVDDIRGLMQRLAGMAEALAALPGNEAMQERFKACVANQSALKTMPTVLANRCRWPTAVTSARAKPK